MRASRWIGAVALWAMAGLAQAGEPMPSPLYGTWAVDVARLPMPPEARPRSVHIRFAPAPDGRLSTLVEVVGPDGMRMSAASVSALDGVPVAVQGNLEADTASTTMPRPDVLVMQLSRAGVPGSTRIYTLDASGDAMTETGANYGDDGKPMTRVNHFARVLPRDAD